MRVHSHVCMHMHVRCVDRTTMQWRKSLFSPHHFNTTPRVTHVSWCAQFDMRQRRYPIRVLGVSFSSYGPRGNLSICRSRPSRQRCLFLIFFLLSNICFLRLFFFANIMIVSMIMIMICYFYLSHVVFIIIIVLWIYYCVCLFESYCLNL